MLKGLGTAVTDSQPVAEEVIIPTWLEQRSAANTQSNEPLANVPTEPTENIGALNITLQRLITDSFRPYKLFYGLLVIL